MEEIEMAGQLVKEKSDEDSLDEDKEDKYGRGGHVTLELGKFFYCYFLQFFLLLLFTNSQFNYEYWKKNYLGLKTNLLFL